MFGAILAVIVAPLHIATAAAVVVVGYCCCSGCWCYNIAVFAETIAYNNTTAVNNAFEDHN